MGCSNKKTQIRVRLLDGKTLTKVFNEQENLRAVVTWIQSHVHTEQFGLMINFPKKVFTHEDYGQSLHSLDLVPSASIIVTQIEKWNNLKAYHEVNNDDGKRKAEEERRRKEVEEQLKKSEEERLALERVRAQIEDDKTARRQRWPEYEYSRCLFVFILSRKYIFFSLYQRTNQPQALLDRSNRSQDHLTTPSNKKYE